MTLQIDLVVYKYLVDYPRPVTRSTGPPPTPYPIRPWVSLHGTHFKGG